jgi:hypothetical protein
MSPFFGYFFFSKNHNEPTKSSLIGENSPNLVPLIAAKAYFCGCNLQAYFCTVTKTLATESQLTDCQ